MNQGRERKQRSRESEKKQIYLVFFVMLSLFEMRPNNISFFFRAIPNRCGMFLVLGAELGSSYAAVYKPVLSRVAREKQCQRHLSAERFRGLLDRLAAH
jgi:hypothetical protein